MADAHAEGLHADLPREGCPECEGRTLAEYPPARKRFSVTIEGWGRIRTSSYYADSAADAIEQAQADVNYRVNATEVPIR
jgi:hypothetical protein